MVSMSEFRRRLESMKGFESNHSPEVEKMIAKKGIDAFLLSADRYVKTLKVIYTDVDGTLLGPIGCMIRDHNFSYTIEPVKALIRALEGGIDVVLVSGRNKQQLRETARILGLRNYIAELGTETVYDLGDEIIRDYGAMRVEEGTLYQAFEESGVIDFLFHKYSGRLELHLPWSLERDCTPLLRGYIEVEEVNKVLIDNGFSQMEIVDNGSIPKHMTDLDIESLRAYHIMPKGVSKQGAVEKDLRRRNIDRKEAVSMGDAVADTFLSKVTGACFIMKNGLLGNEQMIETLESEQNIFLSDGLLGAGWAKVVNALLDHFCIP